MKRLARYFIMSIVIVGNLYAFPHLQRSIKYNEPWVKYRFREAHQWDDFGRTLEAQREEHAAAEKNLAQSQKESDLVVAHLASLTQYRTFPDWQTIGLHEYQFQVPAELDVKRKEQLSEEEKKRYEMQFYDQNDNIVIRVMCPILETGYEGAESYDGDTKLLAKEGYLFEVATALIDYPVDYPYPDRAISLIILRNHPEQDWNTSCELFGSNHELFRKIFETVRLTSN